MNKVARWLYNHYTIASSCIALHWSEEIKMLMLKPKVLSNIEGKESPVVRNTECKESPVVRNAEGKESPVVGNAEG